VVVVVATNGRASDSEVIISGVVFAGGGTGIILFG
jgi:hypothetical protein